MIAYPFYLGRTTLQFTRDLALSRGFIWSALSLLSSQMVCEEYWIDCHHYLYASYMLFHLVVGHFIIATNKNRIQFCVFSIFLNSFLSPKTFSPDFRDYSSI